MVVKKISQHIPLLLTGMIVVFSIFYAHPIIDFKPNISDDSCFFSLTFHDIGKSSESVANITNSVDTLTDVLTYLHGNHYSLIRFDEIDAVKCVDDEKYAMLFFDDGWKSHIHEVLPILMNYEVAATFSINAAHIGREGYLTWDDVRELSDAGMEIAGHGLTHTELSDSLPGNLLSVEITTDKASIEKEIGHRITSFVFPYNTYSEKTINSLRNAGYSRARTGERIIGGTKEDFVYQSYIVTDDQLDAILNSIP